MLINPDLVKAVNEEYERRLAAFQLERRLREASTLRTQYMAHLVASWAALTWQQIRWTPPVLNEQADVSALRRSS